MTAIVDAQDSADRRHTSAVHDPLGVFSSQADVGAPANAGSAIYDPRSQSYRVAGSGENMWFDHDEFHFVWKQIEGDFILTARASLLGEGVDPHRKLGWMVRESLAANSPHVNAAVHGDGLTSLQFRRREGGDTEEVRSTLTGADVIQLERRGERYTMSVARFGQPLVKTTIDDLSLSKSVYVGIFVCSHNPDVIEEAAFSNVRITIPAAPDFRPYRDYLGSRLETLDVDTGDRQVLWQTPKAIEAPNWLTDDSALVYNSEGHLYRFDFENNATRLIDTGFADRNNNDHVLSFDGRLLGISHHAAEDNGRSVIYTLPIDGGTPQRVTSRSPSYLHGWSPDGDFLVFTGQRDSEFDIYRIAASGGDERRLTSAEGLDDGPEYTPDGRYIYFNSARTGTMQIWRMRADGSEQQQVTNGPMNDWFPHISPDGKRIVFLSFPPEVAADQHPYYQHVLLRMMNVDGSDLRVVAYVYGGQGTINVPSWAPDSRRIAFVSHSD